jgi:excisionase family DNA binding protein
MPEEYLTTAEAAAILKVSTETLRRYLRAKPPILTATKIKRQYRITRNEIDRLLAHGYTPDKP